MQLFGRLVTGLLIIGVCTSLLSGRSTLRAQNDIKRANFAIKAKRVANLSNAGNLNQALDEACELLQYTRLHFAHESPELAAALMDHGRCCRVLAYYDKSLRSFREAHAICLSVFGPDHRETLRAELWVGKGLWALEADAKAKQVFDKLTPKIVSILGSDTIEASDAFKFQGLLQAAADHDSGLEFLAKAAAALSAMPKIRAYEQAQILLEMATIIFQSGQIDEAETLLYAAQDILQRMNHPGCPYLVRTLMLLAEIHCQEGNYIDAREETVKALEIATRELGPEHKYVTLFHYGLGCVYYREEEYERAAEPFRKAIRLFREHYQTGDDRFRAALRMLAEIDEVRGRPESAAALRIELMPHLEVGVPEDDAEMTVNLERLIILHRKLGRPGEAAKYEKRLEAIEARSQSLKDTTDQSRPQERPVSPHNTRQRTQDPGNSLREDLRQSMPDQHSPIDSRMTRFKVVGSPCDVPFAVNATDTAGGIAGVSYPTCKSIRRLEYGPTRHATPPIHRTQRSQENEGWEADPRYWPRDNDSEEEAGYFLRDVTTNGGVRLR